MSRLRLGAAALYLAVVLFSLETTLGFADWATYVVLLFAVVPVGIYLGATRRLSRPAVIGLAALLLAQAVLYAAAVPAYDDDAQGALLFFFVPFWGGVALGVGWGIVEAVEGWRSSRRRP